jgi:hypothetical protein
MMLHALAHHGAAQGADPVEQEQAEPARALDRQEVGEQRTVEEVDCDGAALHVGASCGVITRRQIGGADITAVAPGRHHQFPDQCRVAQAEIEPLRADRWDAVCGFADEHHAVAAERARGLDRQREHAVSWLDLDPPQNRVCAPFDLLVDGDVVERCDALCLRWLGNAD